MPSAITIDIWQQQIALSKEY